MNTMADNRSGFVLSTPEQEGISTDSVKRFLTRLENKHTVTLISSYETWQAGKRSVLRTL